MTWPDSEEMGVIARESGEYLRTKMDTEKEREG
jgi:hypothetical protein